MSTTQLTNAGSPLQISGKEYTASVLTDRDYDDLSEWIRARFIQLGKAAADLETDAVKRKSMIGEIISQAASLGWGTIEGANIISTLDGVIRLGWQMCRKRHPNLTIEDFSSQFKRDVDSINANIEAVQEKYAALNFVDDQGGSSTENSKSESAN